MTGCTVRNNNTKGFDRGWEAGGDKICLTRRAVIENSVFTDNRGNGIWFDIGNEDCEVRNCLIANNEDAGIFYEISYGLHAHDNVIIGNGLAFTPGAWGAAAGISLSSSPSCTIERNLLLGNKEGFNFREQSRSTPRIANRKSEPVWNHDQIIRHNVLAFNRDAQVWGWFDVADERHWPKSMQSAPKPSAEKPAEKSPQPTGLSLEDLKLTFEGNLYCPGPGQDLFNWGVTWKKHKRYTSLDEVRKELSVDQGGQVTEFHVGDYSALDFRVPSDSPAIKMGCYPRGPVPGVLLGTFP
jgi:parallel beta-helix repeat protein